MKAIVFCGPSVTPEDARAVLPQATFRGPAARGDVYLAARRRPRAIALCDGSFDQGNSVWHKEILWALSEGIRVYGAASVGALRAAELARYGMIGVGAIFEQYRAATLDGDDEVAVVHSSAAEGYRPLSEALVNIRATLTRAIAAGALDAEAGSRLVTLARNIFYPRRSFAALLREAPMAGVSEPEVQSLRRFLQEHPVVNQKRLDAFALLARVRADLDATDVPSRGSAFEFQPTRSWNLLREQLDGEALPTPTTEPIAAPSPSSRLLPATARAPSVAPAVWADALERSLALLLADAAGSRPEQDEVQRESEAFLGRRGLLSPEQTAEWLSHNDLDLPAFAVLVYEESLVQRFRERARALAVAQLDNTLRIRGEYPSETTQT